MKKTNPFFKVSMLGILCCQFTAVGAQNLKTKIQDAEISGFSKETQLPNFIRFKPGQEPEESKLSSWSQTSLNLDPAISLIPYNSEKDEFGFTHTRYKQYYHNYPVEGTMLIAHSKSGRVISLNGDFIQQSAALTSPAISEQQALQSALRKVNAKKYMWQSEVCTKAAREAHNDPSFTYYPKGEIVVVHKKNSDHSPASYRLAYKFNVYAETPLYRANVFVDAGNGQILDEQNIICTADVVGTGVTRFSGSVPMTSDNFGTGQYRLRETGRGNGIQTYNLAGGTSYVNTDFTNASSTWNLAGNDQAAADAHWGAEKTYDYYKQTFNRNSIDNNGFTLLSYVHYSSNFVNAYWNGSEMTYGDGNVSQGFLVMTALDVCGHEITHGLTSNTAALGSGEAGALNEGFSDIFGTTIENFARPSQHDWIMGADITCNASGVQDHKGIRDMSNPKAFSQPDTYMGTNWDPNGEVHNNNGPCIFWYYLMCQGKSGTNDKGSAYNVTAIGMSDAAKIAFRALTVYFTPTTAYADARTYSIQAATDLFGSCGQQTITCTNAWYAVGVGAQYSSAGVASAFSASSLTACSLPDSVHFINSTSNGSSYKWTFGDGGTSIATNPVHAYTQAGNFTVKLVALGCGGSTKDSVIKTSYISINPPAAPSGTGASGCSGSALTLNATGGGTLTWMNAAGTKVGTGTSYTTPPLTNTTTYYVTSGTQPASVTGAPATNATLGAGGYLNASHYLIFNASSAFTLKTVDVYASAATGSTPTVSLEDSAGNVLLSQVLNLTAAGLNTVTLNFHINPGQKYRLAATGTNINLYRNNAGATYPISVAGLASITGTDVTATAPAYYYWFYNWVLQADGCTSASTPVTATVSVCTGIQNNVVGALTVYPNPASDNFSIKNISGSLLLKVFDARGQLIYEESQQNQDAMNVNTSGWAQGLYLLNIVNEGKVSTHRILIQH
jgi:bacillolysin